MTTDEARGRAVGRTMTAHEVRDRMQTLAATLRTRAGSRRSIGRSRYAAGSLLQTADELDVLADRLAVRQPLDLERLTTAMFAAGFDNLGLGSMARAVIAEYDRLSA